MKPKLLLIVNLFVAILFAQNIFAQVGITNINTGSVNLPIGNLITDRKGSGVQSTTTGLSGRWDSVGTNFNVRFNTSEADSIFVADIKSSLGVGTRLPYNAIAKVRRVANAEVTHTSDHFPYFVAVNSGPSATDNTGTFLLDGPEIKFMETALVSNNINIGCDNVFQNNSDNVHYGNAERIDYIMPYGFKPYEGADLTKIGFTIFDRGNGGAFKIGGIKYLNNDNDPINYITPITAISPIDFGNNLLGINKDFIIFQKDPNFNFCESRPSVKINANMKGVFISLAKLGFTAGETVFGFSLFANDIPVTSTSTYLQNYNGFPTNTNSNIMLDLVASIGLYSFNQTVLSSSTVLKVSLQNSKPLLQWNASSVADANKVFVQKANTDGVYRDVKEVELNQSSFVDESLIGDIAYYRLKIIMIDGSIKYSNIQFVKSKISTTQLFPTVTNDLLHMSSSVIIKNKPVSFLVYNIDGKLIETLSETGNNFMTINIANLQKGIYIIKVLQNNDSILIQKIIKN